MFSLINHCAPQHPQQMFFDQTYLLTRLCISLSSLPLPVVLAVSLSVHVESTSILWVMEAVGAGIFVLRLLDTHLLIPFQPYPKHYHKCSISHSFQRLEITHLTLVSVCPPCVITFSSHSMRLLQTFTVERSMCSRLQAISCHCYDHLCQQP
jgi:hypothetical protein